MIPDSTIYEFGILTSNVHNAWMRTVSMRMKSDYSYSVGIVYNNFPFTEPTPEQAERIELTAQEILNARAKYPECSLADLYDELTMPPELRKAHHRCDDRLRIRQEDNRERMCSGTNEDVPETYKIISEQALILIDAFSRDFLYLSNIL